jgi:hypothetical protein
VAIGDSFAFGYGVDTHRSFAALANPRVKAVGAPGYSMVQGVRLMEMFGERLRGKLVVWFVFLENDLQDNLYPEMRRYRAPFLRLDRTRKVWEISDEHVNPSGWTSSNLDIRRLFPAFCVPGPLAERAYAAADYLIERAQRICRDVGAQLVVMTIPYPPQLTEEGRATLAQRSGRAEAFDPGLPDRRIGESCRRYGVPLVVGLEHLSRQDYKRREGVHWNERGHRRVARLLGQLHTAFRSGQLNDHAQRVFGAAAHRVSRPAASQSV